jgi:tRNA threonylcarbamoyladenosine biosynthesis protein TsaE
MYRLGDADALYDIGWEDYLESGALCITEWSENVPGVFPEGTVEIHFRRIDDETREIKVKLC